MASKKHVSTDEFQLLRNMFNQFDVDGDGVITRDELKKMMESIHMTELSDEEIELAMQEADKNGDGSINFYEFVGVMMGVQKEETDEDLREAFDLFDSNKSGSIDKQEMFNLSRVLGNPLTIDEVDRMFAKYDTDGNGEIDFAEFVEMYRED
jgi:Ca2+-binding EF-hand superfamily protein